MLKETIESAIQDVGRGRKTLQLCLCVNGLPVLAATYSIPKDKIGCRLHHEDFVGINTTGIVATLNKLDTHSKEFKILASPE